MGWIDVGMGFLCTTHPDITGRSEISATRISTYCFVAHEAEKGDYQRYELSQTGGGVKM